MHADGPVFFETVSELCEAFLHVEPTPEASMDEWCMCEDAKCRRKTVVCIARLTDADASAELFVKCFRNTTVAFPAWQASVHAERQFVRDDEFAAHLRSHEHRRTTLTLLLTYNPCHFSGGHSTRLRNTSCAQDLIAFAAAHPTVRIVVKCSYVYRAHWRTSECPSCCAPTAPKHYASKVRNAQDGIQRLRAAGIDMLPFDAADYELALRHCAPSVRAAYAANGAARAIRARADAFVGRVICAYSSIEAIGTEWACRCGTDGAAAPGDAVCAPCDDDAR